MNKTLNKKDILRQADGIALMFQEHKIKAVLWGVDSDSLEFRLKAAPKQAEAVVRALYMREGVRRAAILINGKEISIMVVFDEFIS